MLSEVLPRSLICLSISIESRLSEKLKSCLHYSSHTWQSRAHINGFGARVPTPKWVIFHQEIWRNLVRGIKGPRSPSEILVVKVPTGVRRTIPLERRMAMDVTSWIDRTFWIQVHSGERCGAPLWHNHQRGTWVPVPGRWWRVTSSSIGAMKPWIEARWIFGEVPWWRGRHSLEMWGEHDTLWTLRMTNENDVIGSTILLANRIHWFKVRSLDMPGYQNRIPTIYKVIGSLGVHPLYYTLHTWRNSAHHKLLHCVHVQVRSFLRIMDTEEFSIHTFPMMSDNRGESATLRWC